MGFLDKFKKKKNPLYDNNAPKYEGYEEDLSDDGSAGLDIYNDPAEPRDFNTESSTVEKPKISEYESTLNEFERLNNDQLDPQSKTSMKHKKEKTLYSTLVKAFRKARYNASNSAKNGADVAKSFDIKNATKTAEEKHFKGLKKSYLYIAIGLFLTLVGMSLLFANNDDPNAPKNAPQDAKAVGNGADIRPTDNKTAEARNIGALSGLPSTYADKIEDSETSVNGLDVSKVGQKDANGNDIHADAKNDERGKSNAASNAQGSAAAAKTSQSSTQRSISGSSNVTPPPMPGAPPMPGSSTGASAPVVRREVSQQEQAEIRAKEQATTSAISFGISNGGVK